MNNNNTPKDSYFSLFCRFLRFGFLAWGGPVAQINMIREELVEQEKWLTPEKFRRVLAIYQALPGPEAHELCVYFGMIRRGRWGGFLAGLGFMLPGFVMVIALAYLYQLYGATALLPLFIGVTPAVAALIVRATHRLGAHNLITPNLWAIAVLSAALSLAGVHFLLIFIACALWQSFRERLVTPYKAILGVGILGALAAAHWVFAGGYLPIPQTQGLFIEGLKAGLLSFGGAYTAIPFLKDSMIGNYAQITQTSFLDAIALSSIVPSPLIIFGTFLGFIAGGLSGAILMTLGIFIPAFSFTLLGHHYLEKVTDNPTLHQALEGISACVIGLLAVTAAQIFIATITTVLALCLFIMALSGLYLMRQKWSIPVVIIGSGILGYALSLL